MGTCGVCIGPTEPPVTTPLPTTTTTTVTTTTTPAPSVVFVEATFTGIDDCVKGKSEVQRINAEILGVNEDAIKIQKCQRDGKIEDFVMDSDGVVSMDKRRNLLL